MNLAGFSARQIAAMVSDGLAELNRRERQQLQALRNGKAVVPDAIGDVERSHLLEQFLTWDERPRESLDAATRSTA